MTKYKALYRAVRHLTVADYQLNGRVMRRAAGYRATDHRGRNATRRTGDGESSNGRMASFALLHARQTLSPPDPSVASVRADAGPPSR
jgi:hypothetical protein